MNLNDVEQKIGRAIMAMPIEYLRILMMRIDECGSLGAYDGWSISEYLELFKILEDEIAARSE